MVRYDLTALQARDPVARSSSPTLVTGAVADEGRVDELSPGGLRQFPARGSEFQSFVDQVAELARISPGQVDLRSRSAENTEQVAAQDQDREGHLLELLSTSLPESPSNVWIREHRYGVATCQPI